LLSLPILRRTIETSFYNRFWQEVLNSGEGVGTACPTCSKPMNIIPLGTAEAPLTTQVCRACNVVWLTPEERAVLPVQPAPTPAHSKPEKSNEPELPPEAAQLAAIHQVELIAERAKRENQFDASHIPFWQKFLANCGFPVEDTQETSHPFPWVTAAVVIATSAASIYFFTSPIVYVNAVDNLGFIPSQFDRQDGLTFLSCFIVHGGWLHLIGNMYFLFTFGRGVEAKIGPLGILVLLALATAGGDLFSVIVNPDSEVPHIGASGGIAGVLLFYAFAFPKRRLVFQMPTPLIGEGQLIRMPALAVLALWVGIQIFGVFFEHAGMGNVAYSGHLGGLFVGLVWWLLWRWKNSGGLIKVEK
jgi:membrane associated rhomboid family serine protease